MKVDLKELPKKLENIRFSRFQFKLKEDEDLKYIEFGTDEDGLLNEFRSKQVEYLSKIILEVPEDSILDLSQADERKKAIYFLDQKILTTDFCHILKLANSSIDCDLLKYEGEDFAGIDYLISRFDLAENQSLITFKIISPVQTIYTDKAMQKKERGYKKPKNNLFRIPQNFDFFIYEKALFINNLDAFEKKNSTLLSNFRKRETAKAMKIIEDENMLSKSLCHKLTEYLDNDETLSRKIVKAKSRLQNSSQEITEIKVISYINEFSRIWAYSWWEGGFRFKEKSKKFYQCFL